MNDVRHEVYADAQFPIVALSCSCGKWSARLPVIAGTKAWAEKANEHRREVFGLPT